MTAWTSRRAFDLALQESFARLSGDWNPLHVDPVAARRTLFGKPAVHGMHLVLWVLDQASQHLPQRFRIQSLSASFAAPVPLDRVVSCTAQLQGTELSAHLECGERRTTVVRAAFTSDDLESLAPLPQVAPLPIESPMETRPEEIANARGAFTLQLDPTHAAELFPSLAVRLPPAQLAELTAVTRMVGMRCPGLHSLLSRVDLEASPSRASLSEGAELSYRVQHYAGKFHLARLEVRGPMLGGRVEAFVRPGSVSQPSVAALKALVQSGEFAGQRALVVGGSRGLGEVCAKLLAAGGADVNLTYHLGKGDAQRIAAEIAANGGRAAPVSLDVLDTAADPLEALPGGWRPTYLYYFATPFIFDGVKGGFSAERFDAFAKYYVHGFSRLFRAFQEELRGVFYPSSTALDELPPAMGEYVAAKAAGEGLCAFLAATNPRMRIVCRRLPRLMTDQTQSLVPTASADPVQLMLHSLRELQERPL